MTLFDNTPVHGDKLSFDLDDGSGPAHRPARTDSRPDPNSLVSPYI